MITSLFYKDTPSIINDLITTARPGQSLRYSALSAEEKRDYLFDNGIRATAYAKGSRPDVVGGLVQFAKSSLESIANHLLSETITRISDELKEPRPKLFHTYGTTAKILFTPEAGTRYTGMFGERAYGLARFSYAGPVLGIGVVPGLGMKFFVDGDNPSQNLVAMRKLDRQQSLSEFASTRSQNSVFQNPFTNILPLPALVNLVMRAVKQRFETVVEAGRGLHQPVDNLARIQVNGAAVPAENVLAPHRIIFQPTPEARSKSDPTIDFRDDLAKNIASGTTIYNVFALDETQETELNKDGEIGIEDLLSKADRIGTITTASEFVASKYGDYRLFFKHHDQYLRQEFRKKSGKIPETAKAEGI
jgi:hypothetical protein